MKKWISIGIILLAAITSYLRYWNRDPKLAIALVIGTAISLWIISLISKYLDKNL